MKIQIKRVYDQADKNDGFRILVDRLWPRGLARESANIDLWLKSIAPSDDLRKWFSHDSHKWSEFKIRYFAELDANSDSVNELLSQLKSGNVCLLFSSKELNYNNAVALKDYIDSILN